MVGVESLHLAFSGPSWKERVRARRALSHQWKRGFLRLHKRRLAKFNGVQQHLNSISRSTEWRWRRDHHELAKELWFLLKKYHHLLV